MHARGGASQVLLPPFAWLVGRSAQPEPRELHQGGRRGGGAGWFRAGFEEVQNFGEVQGFVKANAVEL